MELTTNEAAAAEFANNVARAVVRGAKELVRANVDRTVELTRRESLAFLLPPVDGPDKYAEARECGARGTIHEGYLVGLVAAEVIDALRRAS